MWGPSTRCVCRSGTRSVWGPGTRCIRGPGTRRYRLGCTWCKCACIAVQGLHFINVKVIYSHVTFKAAANDPFKLHLKLLQNRTHFLIDRVPLYKDLI